MFGGVRRWIRQHPRVVDGAVAVPVFAYNLPVQTNTIPGDLPYAAVWALSAAFSAGLCLPYVVRRDHPVPVFAVMVLTAFAQWLLGIFLVPADVMLVLGLYNVAARCSRRTSVATAGVAWFGGLLAVLRWGADPVAEMVTGTILICSVWIWGYTIGTRRAYLASLEERAVRLARERDNQARIAAAAERARIAREMHDVVSHSLSVIVVQADGAAYSVRGSPERAERALAAIGDTGRGALTEMRRMLGVLRDGDSAQDAYTPQPGTAQIDGLVEDARRSGLPVELAVEGTPRALPTGMELAAYRIVQEALTNARKHAGPALSRVRVRLLYSGEQVEIRVCDDGRGAAAPPTDAVGGGHGLLGMRERAAAYGGSVDSGPRPGGGFTVVARLPLDTEA